MKMTLLLMFQLFATTAVHTESVAGVRWTAPDGWTPQAARPMRAATYTVAAARGDEPGAECVGYFFGEGQGGSLQANLARWRSQFRGDGGKIAAAHIATPRDT